MRQWLEKAGRNFGMLPVLCAAASFLLYMILMLASGEQRAAQTVTELERELYGGNGKVVELLVDGLGEGTRSVSVAVQPQEYTQVQAGIIFDTVMSEMGEWILGDNVSLMEVRSDLNLETYLSREGVRLHWLSGMPDVIDAGGRVTGTDISELGEEGHLAVRLSAGSHSADYEIAVKVFPPVYSQEEQTLREFLRTLSVLDEEQKYNDKLSLPGEYRGSPLHYHREQAGSYWIIPLAGSAAAILLVLRQKEQEQKQRKIREQQMLMDYSEVVSKFMVFLGAGMTIRLSLERIVDDYKKAVESGRQKPRYAYEELSVTCYQIRSGVSEGKAYRELGERCRVQPYLKLGSLFEQNRKSGLKDLRVRMKAEMDDAFELRKNLVKRLGEEANTKLALPLFMMLGVVMVIVLFPALMNIT